jgi:hypothetical protein
VERSGRAVAGGGAGECSSTYSLMRANARARSRLRAHGVALWLHVH